MAESLRNENNDSIQTENPESVFDINASVFAASVESFCSADVNVAEEKRRFRFVLPAAIRLLVLIVSFAVFCYSVFSIATRVSDDNEQKNLYDLVRPKDIPPSAVERPSRLGEPNIMPTLLERLQIKGDINEYVNPPEPETVMTPEDYRNAIAEVYRVNKDVYGWIVVTGTDISYPIMHGDNDFYLYHNYKRQETKSGSIFAEMSLSPNHSDNFNALIYGHDMRKGMFRGIKVWYESANMRSLADSMEIQIYTMDALYVYKFFSAYRSSDFNFTKIYFKDKEEYQGFLDSIYKRSVLNKKFKYNADETKICTLVTCTNVPTNPDERYVLHGILTRVVPYS